MYTTYKLGDGVPTKILNFYVNGIKIVEQAPNPEWSLAYYLRNKLHLTGTKVACATGGCGSCTVIVSRRDISDGTVKHYTVNACLTPVCSLHGVAVTTVEGIGSIRKIHPVQESIAKAHGSQCGFCTPGMVVSMCCVLQNNNNPTVVDIEDGLQGNLCRCTGYRPIVAGGKNFVKGCAETCNDVNMEECCQVVQVPEEVASGKLLSEELVFKSKCATWYQPVTLAHLYELKAAHADARVVVGNAEAGLDKHLRSNQAGTTIFIGNVAELNVLETSDKGLVIGGAVTVGKLHCFLKKQLTSLPEHQTRSFRAVVEILKLFAGPQVRNVVGVASTIATGRSTSDLGVVLLTCGATLNVGNKGGHRCIKMADGFFQANGKTSLACDEIITSIVLPFTVQDEYVYADKQMRRQVNDVAIVNTAMRVLFDKNSLTVKEMELGFGGQCSHIVMAHATAKSLAGVKWEDNLLTKAYEQLVSELRKNAGFAGPMQDYRLTLCLSFFFKFFARVQIKLAERQLYDKPPASLDAHKKMALEHVTHESSGVQVFDEVSQEQSAADAVGRPTIHQSAIKQATGEAIYLDDIPHAEGELYLAFVWSQSAHAKLLGTDTTEALQMPGVVGYVDHRDVPGSNMMGFFMKTEPLFAVNEVTFRGQVIGAIVANTMAEARRAAAKVKVNYEELPVTIALEDAIAAKAFAMPPQTHVKGKPDEAMAAADQVITGEISIGGQKHFYLETQCCLVTPCDVDELEIFSSAQSITGVQEFVCSVLGIHSHKVTVRAKRLGGAFGGKERGCTIVAAPAAIAAQKYKRPVRAILDRDDDLVMSGGRHPYIMKYKIGVKKDGEISAVEAELYCNAGTGVEYSMMILGKTLVTFENGYKIPNLKVIAHLCRTNLAPNVAFRGFGVPQAVFLMEHIVTHAATALHLPPERVRARNLLSDGDEILFHQFVKGSTLDQCWQQLLEKSDFQAREKQVEAFNKETRWRKRGLCAITTKFGISMLPMGMGQGAALVNINMDGSVNLFHGGVEMGQGLNTKMLQCATRVLNIPIEKIHTIEQTTNTVPNSTGTFGSTGADLNGMAVVRACQTLADRLEPYKAAKPTGSWEDWVKAAYNDRVSLSATGFNKIEGNPFNHFTHQGEMASYYVFGAACSEVEIDCLTGNYWVLRTDIVMDVGQSLNPGVDIGQIEGAFMQGLGLYTTEEVLLSPDGQLITDGPVTYKLPTVNDIPSQLNVSLLHGSHQPIRSVYSSKGVGEPPYALSASAFFAIHKAIAAARTDAGVEEDYFRLDSPATAEVIRMACVDDITRMCTPSAPNGPKCYIRH